MRLSSVVVCSERKGFFCLSAVNSGVWHVYGPRSVLQMQCTDATECPRWKIKTFISSHHENKRPFFRLWLDVNKWTFFLQQRIMRYIFHCVQWRHQAKHVKLLKDRRTRMFKEERPRHAIEQVLPSLQSLDHDDQWFCLVAHRKHYILIRISQYFHSLLVVALHVLIQGFNHEESKRRPYLCRRLLLQSILVPWPKDKAGSKKRCRPNLRGRGSRNSPW